MTEVLYLTNTAGTEISIPATDGTLISGAIKPNQYQHVRIQANLQVRTTGTSSTTNLVTFKIKLGNTVLFSETYENTTAIIGRLPLSIEYVTDTVTSGGGVQSGGTISVTASGAGADANTFVTGLNLVVHSLE